MRLNLANLCQIGGLCIGLVIFELNLWNIPETSTSFWDTSAKDDFQEEQFFFTAGSDLPSLEPIAENITRGVSSEYADTPVNNTTTGETVHSNSKTVSKVTDPATTDNIADTGLLSGQVPSNGADNADTSYKSILFWNSFFGGVDYGMGLGTDALKHHNCPVHQCRLTANRSEMITADALLIHGFMFQDKDKPKRSSLNQIFVFFIFENPLLTQQLTKLSHFNDMFNLTFSYLDHPDTDIRINTVIAKRDNPVPEAIPSIDVVQSKKRYIFWIVSNCRPNSARIEYAKRLSEYIPVDIYGACGNMACPDGSRMSNASCLAILSKQYMFYLAFENSFCQDYRTEKVWNPLSNGLVPITMGGSNYSKYLPPNSFIDVRDFESPKELADRLKYLRDHPDVYMTYLDWRKDYYIRPRLRPIGFCQLCEILHTPNYPYKSRFNVDQYWDADKLCLNKTEHMNMLQLE